MRYVRPREYPLNPRAPIDLLDEVVERFQYSRRTFTEEEALAAVWACGEDIRLREDPRFWEIAGCGHSHLLRLSQNSRFSLFNGANRLCCFQ